MLIKEESTPLLDQNSKFMTDSSDNDFRDDDSGGGLEIDLDYNDYLSVGIKEEDEPLDLSLKGRGREEHVTKLPTLDIKPNFNFSQLEEKPESREKEGAGGKGKVVTEREISLLLAPHVRLVNKKVECGVCQMRFSTREKAVAHVENKHVDCLSYKCPLCRASKVTRLSYESHLRRGHNARVSDYSPVIKLKRSFRIKTSIVRSQGGGEGGQLGKDSELGQVEEGGVRRQQYDMEFVTFLRHILSLGKMEEEGGGVHGSWHRAIAPAEWIDQEQGIFRINNRQEFATGWYTFKGLDHVSWDSLYNSVITSFRERNILKQLSSDDLVFQVFCIKQLLK